MNKEANRVCGIIKTNIVQKDPNSGVLVARISGAKTIQDVLECASIIAKSRKIILMLLATSIAPDRSMFVATVCPAGMSFITQRPENAWIDESIASVCIDGAEVSKGIFGLDGDADFATIYTAEISYSLLTKDYDHEKMIDQVNCNSFIFLRSHGLYIDPPEEKEYTFDDIDGMEGVGDMA